MSKIQISTIDKISFLLFYSTKIPEKQVRNSILFSHSNGTLSTPQNAKFAFLRSARDELAFIYSLCDDARQKFAPFSGVWSDKEEKRATRPEPPQPTEQVLQIIFTVISFRKKGNL